MSTEYGSIFSSRDVAGQLRDANRDYEGRKTWEKMYSNIDLAEKQQLGLLQKDYAKQLSDAYTSSYLSKQAINASNMGQGYKLAADENVDAALEEAFNSYRMNYLQNKANVEAASAESVAAVDDALKTQADYTVRMANAPYGYLQELWNRYAEGEEKDNIFFNDSYYKDYIIDRATQDDISKGIHDYQLKTWDEIKDVNNYDINSNGQKEWKGLFDENGNLTVKGADFYDKMMNERADKGDYSFGQWLMENDSDLYDWAKSYNPYDYTEAGTNRGTFNTLVGLTSTDQKYSFLERYGGLTEKELNEKFDGFMNKVNDLSIGKNSNNASISSRNKNVKEFKNDYSVAVDELTELAKELGIADTLEQSGISFDDLASQLKDSLNNILTSKELRKAYRTENRAYFAAELSKEIKELIADYYEQTDEDSRVTKGREMLLDDLGLSQRNSNVIDAISKGLAYIVQPILSDDLIAVSKRDINERNANYAKAAKEAYTNFVAELVKYAQQQRANAQKEFNI